MGSPHWKKLLAVTCGPLERGAHARASLLVGLVMQQGLMLEEAVPEGLHPMGRDPCWCSTGIHTGAVYEEL